MKYDMRVNKAAFEASDFAIDCDLTMRKGAPHYDSKDTRRAWFQWQEATNGSQG